MLKGRRCAHFGTGDSVFVCKQGPFVIWEVRHHGKLSWEYKFNEDNNGPKLPSGGPWYEQAQLSKDK
jgi:hypothetical protein